VTSEERDDMKQLNEDVLQFSENTAIDNKSVEYVSSEFQQR
jgi:hypothetical protein